jgi:uncharacterized protein (DUF1786 family)
VGGGTQDILILDTSSNIENSVRMIMPSPTQIVAHKINEATKKQQRLLFTGTNMGGGPNKWALEKHLERGYEAFATPQAACSFDDDMDEIRMMGVKLVSENEARELRDVVCIELKDVDLDAIGKAVEAFGMSPRFDAMAVAVLDHGVAPKGFSDRVFRFQHLRQKVVEKNELISFAYLRDEIPSYLTRMKAVAESIDEDLPLLLMDTGPAAALGSLLDEEVSRHEDLVIANLGNFHTLAFHLHGEKAVGLFEHHTELLNAVRLDRLIKRLVAGEIKDDEIFAAGGHGSYILQGDNSNFFLAVCGPRRHIMRESHLKPYFVAPYGDMMLTGCFGLVSAFVQRIDKWREEINRALYSHGKALQRKFKQ